MQTWRAKGLLFSLSDEGVNAHHVPAFKLACQAGRSRGANQFAFDESRAMLCVAAKRRLILSHYNGEPSLQSQQHPRPFYVNISLLAHQTDEVVHSVPEPARQASLHSGDSSIGGRLC